MNSLLEVNLREYLKLKNEEKVQYNQFKSAEEKWRVLNEKTVLLEKGDPTYFGVGANISERYVDMDGQTIRILYNSSYKCTTISVIKIEKL